MEVNEYEEHVPGTSVMSASCHAKEGVKRYAKHWQGMLWNAKMSQIVQRHVKHANMC